MVELAIFVELLSDGVPVEGFPYAHRVSVEQVQTFLTVRDPAAVYRPGPTQQIFDLRAVVMKTNGDVCVRLNGQEDGQIDVNAGGVLVVMDTDFLDSPISNFTVLNKVGNDPVTLQGLGAGSSLDAPRAAEDGNVDNAEGGFGD